MNPWYRRWLFFKIWGAFALHVMVCLGCGWLVGGYIPEDFAGRWYYLPPAFVVWAAWMWWFSKRKRRLP